MTRKLWVFATAALFSATAVMAGLSHTRSATACDKTTETAAASTSSCCAKDGSKTASTDAKKVHNAMVKSAVVAPGAAPILNVAAFAGGVSADCPPCDWCPAMGASASASKMSAQECAAQAAAAGCAAAKGAATTASYEGCPHSTTASVASAGHSERSQTTAVAAASENCCKSGAATTAAASHEACEKSAAVKTASAKAAGGSCCKGEAASTEARAGKCGEVKTASLKDVVDEMPYAESKRVVLAGSYACGHCTLDKMEDCAPMLKTAEGKVYPLLRSNQAKDLRSLEGRNIEVSGNVKKINGVKYLDVKSYKVI